MQPYYSESGITIYHGDCREVLPTLEFSSVVTDPPYGVNAEAKPHGDHSGVIAAWDASVPYDLREAFGSKPTIWFGASTKISEAYQTFSRVPDRMLIWAPRFTLSMISGGGIAYRFHPIYTWDLPKQKPSIHDVFTDPTECGNWWVHQATKPVSLMQKLVNMVGDGIICDPYCGSGTTLVAAKTEGRSAIGIEINEAYCEIAANRLKQGVLFGIPAT